MKKSELKQIIKEEIRKVLSENEKPVNENKIGNIDLDLVKQLKNSPEVKKLAQKLQSDKNLLNKALKFVANNASNQINEDEEMEKIQLQYYIVSNFPNSPEYITYKSDKTYLAGKDIDSYSADELKQLIKAYKEDKESEIKNIQDKSKMTLKDKVGSILTNAGLGALVGSVLTAFITPNAASLTPGTMAVGLITSALAAIGLGALGTSGYKRKMFEDETLDIRDQVLKIIDLGKQV